MNKELIESCEILKNIMSLTTKQLEFIDEICYINRGMWSGDTTELIRAEAKRELGLSIKSIKYCTAKELAEHFKNNGEEEWIIKTMTQLTQK